MEGLLSHWRNDEEPILDVRHVGLSVGGRSLLAGCTFTLHSGSSLSISGPSGSGKTSLLLAVLGLLRPNEGTIRVGGRSMTGASNRERRALRQRTIGTVFQSGELLPELTAKENIELPALLAGVGASEAEERAQNLLQQLGVPDGDRLATTYSGGSDSGSPWRVPWSTSRC